MRGHDSAEPVLDVMDKTAPRLGASANEFFHLPVHVLAMLHVNRGWGRVHTGCVHA